MSTVEQTCATWGGSLIHPLVFHSIVLSLSLCLSAAMRKVTGFNYFGKGGHFL